MNISYSTYLDEPITVEEVAALDDYNINYYDDDGLIKKIEHMKKDRIGSYTYYLGSNEIAAVILEEFKNEKIDIITRSSYGFYTIEEAKYYIKNNLKLYNMRLYDNKNNMICEQEFNITDLTVVPEKTEKYLYVPNEELYALGFEYTKDGLVNYIWGDWVVNTDKRRKGSIYREEISKYFPTLFIDHPYYENFEFLPNNNI